MPRFFIDVDDGERHVRDEAGIDLMQIEDVEHEVRALLLALGQAEMVKGRPRMFSALVRAADGQTIYRASARLRIERVVR